MNYYPRHVGDFIRDTVGLTMLEEGAYNRLLDQYYAREAPLPADKATVYRMARAMTRAERVAVDTVLGQFFVKTPDGWRQKRADLGLKSSEERSEVARQTALRRWQKRDATADAKALPTHIPTYMPTDSEGTCIGNANQKPNNTLGLSSAKDCAVDNSGQDPSAILAEKQVKTASTPRDWWHSNDGIEAKAKEVGITARTGESYEKFKDRVFAAINKPQQTAA